MAENKEQVEQAKANKPVKPAKKSWSNPVLRAMGIPRVSLPSRNWMIFWTALASIGGGIYYDRHQQKKIREKYTSQVSDLGKEIYAADRLPRKLSVFIAPPPDDFLEESLRHFRRYIKPILNAAAIDFTVYTESRQGDIRSQVAERIRQLRRERAEQEVADIAAAEKASYAKSWTRFFKETLPNSVKSLKKHETEPEKLVSRHELYQPVDVLGLYKVIQPLETRRDHGDDALLCGGVVCIGRGAYKEYINGVHEGLLGPLEEPEEPPKPVSLDSKAGEEAAAEKQEQEKEQEKEQDKEQEKEEEKEEQQTPKRYILPHAYADAHLAPELDFTSVIRNNKNVPVIFEQPVYVFPLPKLSGISNIPRKMLRFFTRRELAEDVSNRTMYVVEGASRPFEYKDKYLAKEEEINWPKKWVERGRGKNSEWVQDLEVDERVTSRMRVFDSVRE